MPEITGTFTVDPLTDENKITFLTLQNDDLRAALDAMTAERDFANAQLADGAFYKESDIDALEDRAQMAEAERNAARAKALEDACQKLADVLAFGYRENVIVREAFAQAANEISAMKEPKP